MPLVNSTVLNEDCDEVEYIGGEGKWITYSEYYEASVEIEAPVVWYENQNIRENKNMSNLLQETTNKLIVSGKTWDDVLWIGGSSFTISIEDFKRLANREYDSSYGAQEVATDLKIVGKDWWMERGEYDGSEWWVYKKHPIKPLEQKSVKRVIDSNFGWRTLAEMQRG